MEKDVSKFQEDFIKNYDEYLKDLHNLHSHLPFLSKRMKIRKFNKLVCNLYDKKEYVAHIRTLKQALNHGLILKKYIM